MPSPKRGGRGRSAIYDWRVKSGKKEVFAAPKKIDCETWVRDHQREHREKLRLIEPNY